MHPHHRQQLSFVAILIGLTLSLILLLSLTARAGRTALAQEATPTSDSPPTESSPETSTATAPTAAPTLTDAQAPTDTTPVTTTPVAEVPPTPIPTPTVTPTPTPGPPVVQVSTSEVPTGTIVANRTEVTVTFFLEGRLYELPPRRATGIELARPLTALTLYNCAAGAPPSDACFWDPYPVHSQGFYEVLDVAAEGEAVKLLLQEAAPPPVEEIWVQNRTGHDEQILYAGQTYATQNGLVVEIPLAGGGERVHLRHCLTLGEQSVCEWLPQSIQGGVYYALYDTTTPGAVPNSTVTTLGLKALLASTGLVQPTPTPTPEPKGILCRTLVRSLNVRSGPGLQYLVIGKLRPVEANQGQVYAVGRTEAGDWLAVDPDFVPGGWVADIAGFIQCAGDVMTLPLAPITDGRLAPTPTPQPTPTPETPPEAETPAPEAEPTPESGIPRDKALLIVTNAFDHPIRFTLSPDEYDLDPGQSLRLILEPGRVQFTASSAFRNSSGNAEFVLRAGDARELFIHFVPSEDDPNVWELRY